MQESEKTMSSVERGCAPDQNSIAAATERVDSRVAAIAALNETIDGSLPVIVSEILKLACAGLAAHRASFWRQSGDGTRLRLFCRTDAQRVLRATANDARIAAGPELRYVMENGATAHWCRAEDRNADRLLKHLQFSNRTQAALLQPVSVFNRALGLLVVELLDTVHLADRDAEAFLQLVAARVEFAYLAVSTPPETRPTQD